jgi:hypothetical protein
VAPVSRPAVLAASTPPDTACGSGDPQNSQHGGLRYQFTDGLLRSSKPDSIFRSAYPAAHLIPTARRVSARAAGRGALRHLKGNFRRSVTALSRHRGMKCKHWLLHLFGFTVENPGQRQQDRRSARRTLPCAVPNATTVLAEICGGERNMQHRSVCHRLAPDCQFPGIRFLASCHRLRFQDLLDGCFQIQQR